MSRINFISYYINKYRLIVYTLFKDNISRKIIFALIVVIISAISVPVYRDKVLGIARSPSSHTKEIKIAPDILKAHPISLSSLKEIAPSEDMSFPGQVQKDPALVAVVIARAQGRISKLLAREADTVEKSQVLAILQSTELGQAETDYLKTYNRFELMSQQRNRAQELFQHQIISRKDYSISVMEHKSAKADLDADRIQLENLGLSPEDFQELEKQQGPSGELPLRSPINGVVIESNAEIGQLVKAEDELFTVGDLRRVWIVLDIYEKDISSIKEGIPATVLIPNDTREPLTIAAKVSRISHVIDDSTRAAKVWLEVDNTDNSLRIGQAVRARIQVVDASQKKQTLLALPLEAVHKIEGKSIVFAQISETTFEAREVETGWISDKWVEIKSGLKASESVVTQGSYTLKSEYLRY